MSEFDPKQFKLTPVARLEIQKINAVAKVQLINARIALEMRKIAIRYNAAEKILKVEENS